MNVHAACMCIYVCIVIYDLEYRETSRLLYLLLYKGSYEISVFPSYTISVIIE